MAIDREVQARRNREMFPTVSAVLDDFRSVFGPGVTVTYAEENGNTAGKCVEDRMQGKWVQLSDVVIQKQKQGKAR